VTGPPRAARVVAPVAVRSPTASGVGAGPTNPLDREVARLGHARSLLDPDPAGALAELEAYRAEFPDGELATERDFLVVRALLRLGRRAEATARAEALIARDPRGPFVRPLRRMMADDPVAPPTNP